MRPVPFEGQESILGQPESWDEDSRGKCAGLPVAFHEGQSLSMWEPSEAERKAIASGAPIQLSVFVGDRRTQAPVALGVPDGAGGLVGQEQPEASTTADAQLDEQSRTPSGSGEPDIH